ncbi:hypothetical protein MPSEU_000808100 [Mayamaea pseudoterrestris]|nr:hypothetical protein MPSEU_000808100 [Mayamaea pseudoterrestris]
MTIMSTRRTVSMLPTLQQSFALLARRKLTPSNLHVKAKSKFVLHSATSRHFSSASTALAFEDDDGPVGELFQANKEIGPSLIGQTASIRRTFGPRSNAQALLTCGGESLAAHASFDPDYLRAQDWIRSHAVGPAVLSPVLISGLIGALVEAAFPFSVPDTQSLTLLRPLIVGVSVNAKIQVENVLQESSDGAKREQGYQVILSTQVARVRDDTIIAEGTHSIWIIDYQKM